MPVADLSGRVFGLDAGARLVLAGIGLDGIGSRLDPSEAARSLLAMRIAGHRTAAAILDGLLADLADLALTLWPDRPVGHPRAGGSRMGPGAGRPPRFRRAAKSLEFT